MKYDDASWHYGGNFPDGLPPEAGATHIAMFVAWGLLNGFAGSLHTEDSPEELQRLRDRQETPGRWFIRNCDEKFTDEDLNETGNAFAANYYQGPQDRNPPYLEDYAAAFPDHPDLYSVPDTWESYDKLAPFILRRYRKFQAASRPWWRSFLPHRPT